VTAADADWLTAAVHESGHAVAYLHFGWQFTNIRIYEDDDGQIKGSVLSPSGTYDVFARAVCCLAGPIAEERATGVSLEEQAASDIDKMMARDALARVAIDGLEVGSILPFTRHLVDHEWPAIALIASELVQQRQLTYDQVVGLIQR
jgi:hypothetical protein